MREIKVVTLQEYKYLPLELRVAEKSTNHVSIPFSTVYKVIESIIPSMLDMTVRLTCVQKRSHSNLENPVLELLRNQQIAEAIKISTVEAIARPIVMTHYQRRDQRF